MELIIAVEREGIGVVGAADQIISQTAADGVLTQHTEDGVIPVAASDEIITGAGNEPLDVVVDAVAFAGLTIVGGDVANGDGQVVGASAVVGEINADAAADGVAAVGGIFEVEGVVASLAEERVIAEAADERIIAGAALNGVIAGAAEDEIATEDGRASNGIGVRVTADEQVIAAAADDAVNVTAHGITFAKSAVIAQRVVERDSDVVAVI